MRIDAPAQLPRFEIARVPEQLKILQLDYLLRKPGLYPVIGSIQDGINVYHLFRSLVLTIKVFSVLSTSFEMNRWLIVTFPTKIHFFNRSNFLLN